MKKIVVEIFNQYPHKEDESYSQKLLNLLKVSPVPLPLNFLSFLVGIPKFKVCKILKKLQRYYPDKLKKVTITKACFYSFDNKRKKKNTYLGLVIIR